MLNKVFTVLLIICSLLLGVGIGYRFWNPSISSLENPELSLSFETYDPNNVIEGVDAKYTPEPTSTPEVTPTPEPSVEPTPEPIEESTPEPIEPVPAEDEDGYTIVDQTMSLAQPAYLIDSPSPDGEALHHFNAEDDVHIVGTSETEQYWKAEFDGKEGYINKKYIDLSEEDSVEEVQPEEPESEDYSEEQTEPTGYQWNGSALSAHMGTVQGPSGRETYYNLDMSGVISNARNAGVYGEYWVRDDGVKMYGDYILAACDVTGAVHNRYDIVETSLGNAICADTGWFAYNDPWQIDIATTW